MHRCRRNRASRRLRRSQGDPALRSDRPRILTDLEVPQDPLWAEATHHVGPTSSNGAGARRGFLRRSIALLLRQRRYDAVVTSSLRSAQVFGFVRAVLGIVRPVHIHLELMLDDENLTRRWRIKRWVQRTAFASTRLIVISTRSEIDTYSRRLRIPRERFVFVPFHTNVIEPGVVTGRGGYAFSAGRSGRDFALLARAVSGLDLPVVVVSDARSVEGVDFPPNVRLLVDVPYERYLEELHGADFVIVPLEPVVRATGQVVVLEAMATGKPVIATGTTGTVDYVTHEENGLLVPPGDADALAAAIRRLAGDSGLRDRLRQGGLDSVRKHHGFRAYVDTILGQVDRALENPEIAS